MRDNKVLAKGIEGIMSFFDEHGPAVPILEEIRYGGTYRRNLRAAERSMLIHVNVKNLICQIDLKGEHYRSIPDDSPLVFGSMVEHIPAATAVRALDVVQMHAMAIQVSYDDDTVRNYYLKSFEGMSIPEFCDISGFEFTQKTLCSVHLDTNQNAVFDNGMVILRHILYYHSYRQAKIEYPDYSYGEKDGIEIKPLYKLPLTDGKYESCRFLGNADEVFGPCSPWVDTEGKRVSDISIISAKTRNVSLEVTPVQVEPTRKYGFLRDDGSWLPKMLKRCIVLSLFLLST